MLLASSFWGQVATHQSSPRNHTFIPVFRRTWSWTWRSSSISSNWLFHDLTESLRLKKTSEITKSNHNPSSPCSLTRSLSATSPHLSNLQGWGLPWLWHSRAPSAMTVTSEAERAAYISQVLYLCLSYHPVLFHPPKQAQLPCVSSQASRNTWAWLCA